MTAAPATFRQVQRRKTSIGRLCIRTGCHRSATVTALRIIDGRIKLPVRYCTEHADETIGGAR